jgi:hypothetical protein
LKKNEILYLGITLLLALFTVHVAEAGNGPNVSIQQVPESLTLGPIIFSPPRGFWYTPMGPSHKGTDSSITFFKAKDDAMLPVEETSADRNPIIVIRVGANSFKDFDSYYKAESDLYRAKGVDKMHYFKELPANIKALIQHASNWSCREKVNKGYPELTAIDCVSLRGDYGIIISVFCFNEKKVLDMADTLKSTMLSVKELPK